jgi:hypothetical protein
MRPLPGQAIAVFVVLRPRREFSIELYIGFLVHGGCGGEKALPG